MSVKNTCQTLINKYNKTYTIEVAYTWWVYSPCVDSVDEIKHNLNKQYLYNV
jgi:hypothetical protein